MSTSVWMRRLWARETQLTRPLWVWPGYERVSGVARVGPSTAASFITIPRRDSDPTMAFILDGLVDPASRTMYDCGAERVDSTEFWMAAGDGLPITPLLNSDFAVNKLPARRIRARDNIYCRWGVRIGPNASGEYADR